MAKTMVGTRNKKKSTFVMNAQYLKDDMVQDNIKRILESNYGLDFFGKFASVLSFTKNLALDAHKNSRGRKRSYEDKWKMRQPCCKVIQVAKAGSTSRRW